MTNKSTFVPMYDLEGMSEQQRHEYYLSACEYMNLPPELNVLAFHYMDQGDGARKLVLYAKKGATDIIRKNLNISVIDLKKETGSGEVTWIAKGQDKSGRIEMSSGSKSIEGLRGRDLESAIMWAQTKALRRMTLQFVGGGILDETEIAEPATVSLNQAPSLAQAAIQPSVQSNNAPGQLETKNVATFDKPFILTPIPDMSSKPDIRESQPPLTSPGPGWTTFNELDSEQGVISEGIRKSGTELGAGLKRGLDKILMPDAGQRKVYKEKLRVYSDETLPKAGMVPNEHGGIGMRLRAFGVKRAGVKELTELSIEQWEDLFKFFETTVKVKGVAELIRIIDATV
jgi:hypothetical protein